MGAIKRILVVDDDARIRALCSEALILTGYLVESASNGREALDMLNNSAYGLVVSDISMPEIDGITLYLDASRTNPNLKDRFLFITGHASGDAISRLDTMKKKYLLKPFKIVDFLSAVDKLMSKARGRGRGKLPDRKIDWKG